MIESYSFGSMVIGGRVYRSDLIIFPDGRIAPDWWRHEGHRLAWTDIAELAAARPEIIVAGSGAAGMMAADADLAQQLERRGIALRMLPTAEAVELFNAIFGEARVGGCFHLNC